MLVSIITPSYNSERFIKECIISVIKQTYTDWELLIVDDFSSDKTVQYIKEFSENEKRIKPIFLKKNIGPAKARNIALSNAKGDFIAFLDSDDIWNTMKLQKQVSFMLENNIAFSYTSYKVISEQGFEINKVDALELVNYKTYLKNTIIGCLSVVINKNIVGNFEMKNLKTSHDMALWLDIMKRGFVAHGLNEYLASYRLVRGSNTSKKIFAAIGVWKIYRKIENLNFFYSLYCFLFYIKNAIKKRI